MADTPDFKQTLNLPQTAFPMKANLGQLEPRMLAHWESIGLYGKLMAQNAKAPVFTLHDGPPYANGNIHQGHFLNKILKDIVAKYHNQAGHLCDFVPGWDCHGLPIELNVDKELGSKKREMDKVAIRKACRAYAEKFVGIQREQFKRLGVLARWDQPYLTMSFDYEAQTVRELAKFAARGALYRGKKPVHWCMSDRTALAEAEVEYEEHTSPTIYVAFPTSGDLSAAFPALKGRAAEFVIWTTTPWTLPANLAIAIHPDFTYVAYELDGRVLIVAKELLARFLSDCAPQELAVKDVKLPGGEGATFSAASLASPQKILGYAEGKQLEGLKYRHVLFDRESPILLGDHVTLEAGTGLVHTAPGHGQEDYVVGLKYGLPILTPVDAAGRFTEEAGEWAGQKVFDANPSIIARLVEKKALLSDPKASFKHSYPTCWRCHNPVIFRATDQWFVSMEANDLRKKCLEEIDRVRWIPEWGRERIHGMLENRPDWCISRQRTWGVPITVLYCEKCNGALVDPALMNRAADLMEKEGADAWYSHPVSDLLAPGQKCSKCGGSEFRREGDILDVWFDSGVSYAAVAEKRPNLKVPVDLYLEGSDQHRGWFHSTLMCAVATRDHAPYKAVLTHGFVVDEKGEKFSKSRGNFIPPEKIIATYGAEIVRLWVSAADYSNDVRSGENIFKNLAEGYRKIRNTVRYALSNLDGFDPKQHRVAEKDLLPVDRWALAKLREVTAKVLAAYESYDFHLVYHAVLEFCSTTLSATYFDILKDRLYTFSPSGAPRRSAQTVIYEIARDLLRLVAPVMSFTADEAWAFLPGEKTESVFLAGMPEKPAAAADPVAEHIEKLLTLRANYAAKLEEFRKGGNATIDAKVTLPASEKLGAEDLALLPELYTVSQVKASADGAWGVAHADGAQCPRCRRWVEEPLASSGACARCEGQRPWPTPPAK